MKKKRRNRRPMISDHQIDEMREWYIKLGSIVKTAEKVGFCKTTVNKHVKDLSEKKNNDAKKRPIYRVDLKTSEKVLYCSIQEATKGTDYSVSCISKCLNRHISTAYGFGWCFEEYIDSYMILISNLDK